MRFFLLSVAAMLPVGCAQSASTVDGAGPPATRRSRPVDVTTSLVGQWRLDEGAGLVAGDASGMGNDGVLVNGARWAAGRFGGGLVLDGSDDRVEIGHRPALNAFPLSVSLWLKTASNTARAAGILQKYQGWNGYQIHLSNGVLWGWYMRDRQNFVHRPENGLYGGRVDDGKWHHVALVVDARGGRMFLDGLEQSAEPWTGTPGPPTTQEGLNLGWWPSGDDRKWFLRGSVDAVRIYSRTLTPAEVEAAAFADDTHEPVVKVKATAARASETGTEVGAFSVIRSGELTRPLTVAVTTGGAAEAGADYRPVSGSVTIRAGEDQAAVPIAALADKRWEGRENVVMRLLPDPAYVMGIPSVATVIIEDAQPPVPPSATGLLARWKMDEGAGTVAADASGNGNDGTLMDTATWTGGRLGGALALDGKGDYLDVPHRPSLNAFPLTVSAWIKTSSRNMAGIVNKYFEGSWDGYQLYVSHGAARAFYIRDKKSYVHLPEDGVWGGRVDDGRWHHLAFVVDASGGRMYQDGVEQRSQPWTGTPGPVTTTRNINLGRFPRSDNQAWFHLAASVDDVQIYDRALGAADIEALAAGAAP